MANTDILIHRVSPEKRKVIPSDPQTLGFGRHFTDHMFVSEYDPVNGWAMRRIEPYRMLQIDPAMTSLHYGQMCFEGLKAYRGADDGIYIFRWKKNAERLQASCRRLMMEAPPVELFGEALKQLVQIDHDWVPSAPGCSLYLRPFVIATDPFLGVRPSTTYAFCIIASPVGSYYKEGFNPTRILVSDEDVRAVRGGLGEAKTAANYAASLRGFVRATKLGYSQVLWLDAVEHRWVEELNAMNVVFVWDRDGRTVVSTPPLTGTILEGVTRDSLLALAGRSDLDVVVEPTSIEHLRAGAEHATLRESFA
jgi:branched-chain amino acid aminotransferase